MRRMPKFFSSIFFKLMVIILVTGMGINLALIIFFGAFRHHVARSYHPHLNRYIDYLLRDIGDPPSQARAIKIAAQTDMVITYKGPDRTWSTSESTVAIPAERLRIRHRDGRIEAGSYRGRYQVSVEMANGRMIFLLAHHLDAEKRIKALSLGLLLLITSLMFGAYFGIRWVLKPLKNLKHGVDRVASGELSHRVPLQRKDELRDLSDAFNAMTVRLEHLIKSKEQLLLDVSHELRTPVTRMKVALAMMPDSHDKDSLQEDVIEIEKKITELLETARKLNINVDLAWTETDLPMLIRRIARPFEATRPGIRIAPMPENIPMRLDVDQFSRALKNILDNAHKYSPEDAGPIHLSVETSADHVQIIVRDYGVGISDEDIDFIFEPFYRADTARTPHSGGYGLGLSMAKTLIEAHMGDITVHSSPGKGTTVVILLPRPQVGQAATS